MPRQGGLSISAAVPLLAHLFLLGFTILLVCKISDRYHGSWWLVFVPLFAFHAVISRCKCSMPAPNTPNDRQWAPCHTLVLVPLLLTFEILLVCYLVALQGGTKAPPANLLLVFFPLVLLQAIVLADNFRMCMVLMPGEDDNMTDEALWETLPHFAVAVAMVFFLAATVFSALKLSGTVDVLDWWDLLVNFCIGEFFSFLLCIQWTNPHLPVPSESQPPGQGSSQSANQHQNQSHTQAPEVPANPATPLLENASEGSSGQSGELADAETGSPRSNTSSSSAAGTDEDGNDFACGVPEIGGHLIKAGVVVFQVLLCMRLEGTPGWAKTMPVEVLFSPLLVVQVAATLSAAFQLAESVLLVYSSDIGTRLAAGMKEFDPCSFLTRGMRLAGCWTVDDEMKDDRRGSLASSLLSGYNTFDPTPPEHIKKMRKGELTEEVVKLQAALLEQGESSKAQRQELDRIQQEKVLCRICFEHDISLVLMPCRHRILCSFCADKCKQCPICRCTIVERMAVFDV